MEANDERFAATSPLDVDLSGRAGSPAVSVFFDQGGNCRTVWRRLSWMLASSCFAAVGQRQRLPPASGGVAGTVCMVSTGRIVEFTMKAFRVESGPRPACSSSRYVGVEFAPAAPPCDGVADHLTQTAVCASVERDRRAALIDRAFEGGLQADFAWDVARRRLVEP